jgi:DNA-binding beta-propeller fold protein YncE
MRILTPLQVLSAVVVIALLAACSGDSTIAPKLASSQSIAYHRTGPAPSILGPMGTLEIAPRTGHHIKSFDSCPTTGPIKYVADNNNSVIYIYSGKFNGQAPCGQITASLNEPQSIHVRPGTHDFYVANGAAGNILVFHRGQTTPYNTYVDPSNQYTSDVAIAKDGTVIAVNSASQNRQEFGSLSTWKEGPNGGTFIGNFPLTNNNIGEWMTLRKNGTVYFDAEPQTGGGSLWFVSCPAGACGPQTQVAGVSFILAGGMVFDESGDLLVSDWGTGTVYRFELPNPVPKSIPVGGEPTGLAINVADHHFFVADIANHDAAEYLYPGVSLVGVVPCCTEGPLGVAVDP